MTKPDDRRVKRWYLVEKKRLVDDNVVDQPLFNALCMGQL
jgi:hypothetical protein